MKTLTIIIPSYNTAGFIEKNIKTFIHPDLYEDVEILVVNDGSMDKTGEIADRFQSAYPNVIRHIDKENGGHGSVINRGVQEANGKYFKVVDGDDWVHTENLVRLVDELKKTDADIVLNPNINVDQSTGKEKFCEDAKKFYGKGTVDYGTIVEAGVRHSIQSVTYKTSMYRENDIHLTEKCFYEDFQYDFYPVPHIKTALCLDFPVYYYLVGQKTQSVSAESGLRNMQMYIKVYKDSVTYFEIIKSNIDEKTRHYMESWILTYYRSMYNIFLRNYKVGGIVEKMLETDKETKDCSEKLYKMLGERNRYIKVMRSGNRLCFMALGFAFTRYKAGRAE